MSKALSLLALCVIAVYSSPIMSDGHTFPVPSTEDTSPNVEFTAPELLEQFHKNLAVKDKPVSFCDQTDNGFVKVFEDEFEGDVVDETNWTHITDDAREYYHFACGRKALCRRENVYVKDGNLVLVTDRERTEDGEVKFFSGGVNSRTKKFFATDHQVVRVCVRAIPPGKEATTVPGGAEGIFPAYWLMAEDSRRCNPIHGEMDIFEAIRGDTLAYSTYHVTRPGHGCAFDDDRNVKHLQSFSQPTRIPDMYVNYHEYALERGPDYVDFYIDGKLVLASSSRVANRAEWFHNESPYYIWLNTALGAWGGEVNATSPTIFPQYNYIDYVKVSVAPVVVHKKPTWVEHVVTAAVTLGMFITFAFVWKCCRKRDIAVEGVNADMRVPLNGNNFS